jgi:hypothetical protein
MKGKKGMFVRHVMPRTLGLFVLAGALASSACQMARMALPTNLSGNVPEMVCRGRQGFKFNEAFDFLPFQVRDVHRSWTTIREGGAEWLGAAKAKQRYEFTVGELGGPAWEGRCAVGAEVMELELRKVFGGKLEIDLRSDQTLFGTLRERIDREPWLLALGQAYGERALHGVLERGDLKIAISAQHRLAQSSMPVMEAAGYLLSLRGETVAAVEIINRGAVWIHPGVAPEIRGALAAAAAALLLHQDLLAIGLPSDRR